MRGQLWRLRDVAVRQQDHTMMDRQGDMHKGQRRNATGYCSARLLEARVINDHISMFGQIGENDKTGVIDKVEAELSG